MKPLIPARGFTLIELLTALLILSLMALMSYRGLGAVLDARVHVENETGKWRQVSSFLSRFERDIHLASPRPARSLASAELPPWTGSPADEPGLRLVFSRFASAEGVDSPRRVGYGLNEKQEIELWLWPGLDVSADTAPARYPVLKGVTRLDIHYFNAGLIWVDHWPPPAHDAVMPRAVRLRMLLDSGEEIMRVFVLDS